MPEHDAGGLDNFAVLPFCADFEEGELAFAQRLPTAENDGVRLVLLLGNVFGNVIARQGHHNKSAIACQGQWPTAKTWLQVNRKCAWAAATRRFRSSCHASTRTLATRRPCLVTMPWA